VHSGGWGLVPDFVLVGKALSGGYMPVSAMITRRDIHSRTVATLERCYVHQSTYGRNRHGEAAFVAGLPLRKQGIVSEAQRAGCSTTLM
jgi:ornithine--oxo-acid transaminase